MGLPFFDRDSVMRRLERSICLYHGEPVYVSTRDRPREARVRARPQPMPAEGVPLNFNEAVQVMREIRQAAAVPPPANDHIVTIYKLPVTPETQPENVDYRVPAFSYKAFPLGYINSGDASYLMRLPMRQQCQGLELNCIQYKTAPKQYGWFTSQAMKDCILGNYPSMAEAEDTVRKLEAKSVAFDRELALVRMPGDGIGLEYRGTLVGYKSGNTFNLIERRGTHVLKMILRDKVCLT